MLQGILRKQEGLLRRYKKRWFILSTSDNYLRYYSSSSGTLIGEIDMHSIIDVRPLKDGKGGHPKNPYGFQVTTDERALSLYAATLEDRRLWCEGLNERVSILKRMSENIMMQSLASPIAHYRTTHVVEAHDGKRGGGGGRAGRGGGEKVVSRRFSFLRTHDSPPPPPPTVIVHNTFIVATEQAVVVGGGGEIGAGGGGTGAGAGGAGRRSPSTSPLSSTSSPASLKTHKSHSSFQNHPKKKLGGSHITPSPHRPPSSFSTSASASPVSPASAPCSPQMNKRVQNNTDEYVRMSMWMQRQEQLEKMQLRLETERLREQLEQETKKVERLLAQDGAGSSLPSSLHHLQPLSIDDIRSE